MANLYLVHHGIKGMKWGVRKGPPYPLGSGGKPNPFNTKPSESIGQVYFYDPKKESFGPYAPHGNGIDEFHRWCESASNVVYLRSDGGPKKQPMNSLSNSRI